LGFIVHTLCLRDPGVEGPHAHNLHPILLTLPARIMHQCKCLKACECSTRSIMAAALTGRTDQLGACPTARSPAASKHSLLQATRPFY
jgi:hypothetical protein